MRLPFDRQLKSDGYLLVRGDGANFVRTLPSQSVDLIVTDPPYNLRRYSTGNMKFSWRKEINNDLAGWDEAPFDPGVWVEEFRRILKPTGTIFAFTSYNLLGKWHEAFDPIFDTFQFMVWHKTNPIPKFRKAGFLNSCELIVCMWDKGHFWNFISQREMHNFMESPICMGKERVKGQAAHPTQKPVKILSRLMQIASAPGHVVLDPFMGVGSTGVAAVSSGRHFIGVEVDATYFAAAQDRVRMAASPTFISPSVPPDKSPGQDNAHQDNFQKRAAA